MTTITLQTKIDKDGHLHLDIPCGLPPGPVEVVVVVQPQPTTGGPPFETLAGFLAAELPAGIDVEAELQQMTREWEASLEPSS